MPSMIAASFHVIRHLRLNESRHRPQCDITLNPYPDRGPQPHPRPATVPDDELDGLPWPSGTFAVTVWRRLPDT
jgi:hypothetical protein